MISSALSDIYTELEQVDVTRDLDQKSLHISTSGLLWNPAPVIDNFSKEQLLEFYYYMSLTRATDIEIVKMARKGIALGKHLPCTGNEATAVGATSALKSGDWATLAMETSITESLICMNSSSAAGLAARKSLFAAARISAAAQPMGQRPSALLAGHISSLIAAVPGRWSQPSPPS